MITYFSLKKNKIKRMNEKKSEEKFKWKKKELGKMKENGYRKRERKMRWNRGW